MQKKKQSPSTSFDGEGDSFLDRMELMERRRNEKLELATAEAVYSRKVDKLTCPNCGTTQSYDEMVKRSKNCMKEGCEGFCYQNPKRFILKNFEKRMERSAQRRTHFLSQIEEERKQSASPKVRRSQRQKELSEKVSKDGNDFWARMEKDLYKRNDKLYRLEEIAVELEKDVCTFKPKLNVQDHLIRNRTSGLDALATPLRRNEEHYPPAEGSTKKKKKKKKKTTKKPSSKGPPKIGKQLQNKML